MSDQNGGTREQEQAGEGAELYEGTSPDLGIVRCPRCRNTHIRKRSRWASLFIGMASFVLMAIVAFAVFQLAEQYVTQLQWRRGLRLFSLAFMLPYSLVLGVLWSRLLADYHCLECGRHFGMIRSAGPQKADWPFPARFSVLNGIILFASLMASQEMVRLISHGAVSIILMESVLACIGAAFLASVSLVYHGILYLVLRRRITHEFQWVILFLLAAVVLGHIRLYQSFPAVEARILLSNAELSSLPESAHDIKVYHWSSLFAGEEFLRFAAEPDDIETFLSQSSPLQGQEPQRYKIEPTYGFVSEDTEEGRGQGKPGREIHLRHPNGPDWYRPGMTNPARRYEIQPEGYQLPGEVIVDDEQHVVYVYLCFS